MFKTFRIIVKTGLAWCPESISAVQLHRYAINRHSNICTIAYQRIKVKWPLKIRTQYCVVNSCNQVVFVAGKIKLSHVGYPHILYWNIGSTLLPGMLNTEMRLWNKSMWGLSMKWKIWWHVEKFELPTSVINAKVSDFPHTCITIPVAGWREL